MNIFKLFAPRRRASSVKLPRTTIKAGSPTLQVQVSCLLSCVGLADTENAKVPTCFVEHTLGKTRVLLRVSSPSFTPFSNINFPQMMGIPLLSLWQSTDGIRILDLQWIMHNNDNTFLIELSFWFCSVSVAEAEREGCSGREFAHPHLSFWHLPWVSCTMQLQHWLFWADLWSNIGFDILEVNEGWIGTLPTFYGQNMFCARIVIE